jgi:hypothetical protein
MFIEDLITQANYHIIFGNNSLTQFEINFLSSVSSHVINGDGLTEKQAGLALRVLSKIEKELEISIGKKSWDLNFPQYRRPFRQLFQNKIIKVFHKGVDANQTPHIAVAFAYDEKIIKKIKDFKLEKVPSRADWNHETKTWNFSLVEECISWINSNLIPLGFEADDEFKQYVADIENIEANLENLIPMLVLDDGIPKLKNTHPSVPQPKDTDVVGALYHAKKYGISITDENIDTIINGENFNLITKAVMLCPELPNVIWIDRAKHPLESFNEVVDHAKPLLFVIPGGSEYEHLSSWHQFLKSRGFSDSEMSVMFRLPNEGKGNFNIYVKENNLNNEVTENTKAVFVSVKIPKPLVKTNLKFNAIINLGYHFNTHYTMDTMLTSSHTLIFYTDTEPKQKKSWLQQR